MKVLFIGIYADEKTKTRLEHLSTHEGKLSVAAINYTRMIGEGFSDNLGNASTNLYLVPIGMFPICRLIFWKTRKIEENNYIPFINLFFLKQLSIALYVFFFALRWSRSHDKQEKKIIVFSCIYLPFLVAISPLKLIRHISVASFVPDMPEYLFSYSSTKLSIKKIFVPLFIYLSAKIVQITDFYIYITRHMQDRFGNKPFHIIEGLTDSSLPTGTTRSTAEKKAVMYAGALYKKFGIGVLLKAFHEIEGDYELWLFWHGDMEQEIELSLKKDPRIKYWGTRPNQEILSFEKKAKLLVNPRFSINEFTKYSFPSKLMEYMASGTPILTTRLPGIPEDYADKMYYIDDESVAGLKTSLISCLSKSDDELYDFGKHTREYVLTHKNNIIQISNLLTRLRDL